MPAIDLTLARDICRIPIAARRFLEPRWPAYRQAMGFTEGEAPSAATCLITTKFLQRIFAEQGHESECLYGIAENGRGYFNGQEWSNHGWLRIAGFDLDCTGDQFRMKPVSIKRAGTDPWYQAACGTYELVPEEKDFLDRWHREWSMQQLSAVLPKRQIQDQSTLVAN